MAASAKPTKAVNQQDLRRLMKEKRDASKKIDSPLAKYNKLGQLMCIVCNVQVKHESLWSAHIVGKVHKDRIEALKKKPKGATSDTQTPPHKAEKRKWEDSGPPHSHTEVTKKPALNTFSTKPTDPKIHEKKEPSSSSANVVQDKKPNTGPSLLTGYYSDDDEDDDDKKAKSDDKGDDTTSQQGAPASSVLPPDFFDNPADASSASAPVEPMEVQEAAAKSAVTNGEVSAGKMNSAEGLPEGFFDDPILDAKIRKVEYKDPIEEEWERFQRAIAEESTVSQAIIDEDLEESKVEREISEIDEQIHYWARVEALQRKKEQLALNEQAQMEQSEEGSSSADEQDFEEFLDWRAKRVWKQ